jgi:ankyrin repeat protein
VVEGLLRLFDEPTTAGSASSPVVSPSEWKKLLCNATAEQERTPLHLVCSSTRSLFRVQNSIIENLLDLEELAVNTLDSDNNTALHLAAAQGNIDAVRCFFLRKAELVVPTTPQGTQAYKDQTTGKSYRVLNAPTDKRPGDTFQVFVHRDRSRWPSLAKENRLGEDPVASACSSGNDDMVTFLLRHYIDASAVTDIQMHYGDLAKKLALPLAVLDPEAAATFIPPGAYDT